jgi:hypothetical protein
MNINVAVNSVLNVTFTSVTKARNFHICLFGRAIVV